MIGLRAASSATGRSRPRCARCLRPTTRLLRLGRPRDAARRPLLRSCRRGTRQRRDHAGGNRFRGKVVVLIGPQNSSATFNFADLIQRERRGRLIGEPTGGNRRGTNGGAFFFVTLPASTIEVDLPLIGSFPDGDQPDAGLLPDVAVAPTAAAIATGRDDAVIKVVALAA